MKLLKTIPSNRVVAIDIETVRIEENFEELPDRYKSAWEYKNKQDGEIPDYSELEEFWEKRSSLYAEFSKVCAVSLAYLDVQDNLVCKEFYGEDEKALLESLNIVLNNMQAYSPEYRLLAHAGKFFDYPFLCKRFLINEIDLPNVLDTSHLKPWEQLNMCSNELWRMGGTGAGSSLQALCTVLNIPVSKVDLVGDEVGKAYYDGELKRIGTYCSYDTIATFNVFRKLKKESIFEFDSVKYIEEYNDNMEEKTEIKDERTVLEKLYQSNELTEPIQEEIESLIGKKKLTKKDKANLFTILRGIYVRTNFEHQDQDSKKVIAEKEEEINDFINNL
jgi:hypothetical protein